MYQNVKVPGLSPAEVCNGNWECFKLIKYYPTLFSIVFWTYNLISSESQRWDSESESDEDLEDLPRFRLEPCRSQAMNSARAIRSRTLSGNDIEVMRYSHEQNQGWFALQFTNRKKYQNNLQTSPLSIMATKKFQWIDNCRQRINRKCRQWRTPTPWLSQLNIDNGCHCRHKNCDNGAFQWRFMNCH